MEPALRGNDWDAWEFAFMSEEDRKEEWLLDVPTLGHIYGHDRYQTTIVYFNGLGRALDLRSNALVAKTHWFNRAWTLQETPINWLPGGLTPSLCTDDQSDGPGFMRRLREAQETVGLTTTERPLFADLLEGMRRRPGFDEKKPYDRAAALAYLLPSRTRPVYTESSGQQNGVFVVEEAWSLVVESLDEYTRLNFLTCYPEPSRSSVVSGYGGGRMEISCWRPTWDQVMAHKRSTVPKPTLPYEMDEILRGPIRGYVSCYYHTAFVIGTAYIRKNGYIFVPHTGQHDEPPSKNSDDPPAGFDRFKMELFQTTFEDNTKVTLAGIAQLECWIVGQTREWLKLGELMALLIDKITVARVYDSDERRRLRELPFGKRDLVAYCEPAGLYVETRKDPLPDFSNLNEYDEYVLN